MKSYTSEDRNKRITGGSGGRRQIYDSGQTYNCGQSHDRCPAPALRRSRRGHYIIEATMLLPLVLLMILALGYFTKAAGSWENCFHCAADESCRAAAMACDGVSGYTAPARIRRRIENDVTGISDYHVRGFLCGYSADGLDQLSSYTLSCSSDLRLPAGFGNLFEFSSRIRYRNFVGRKTSGDPLGTEGLEDGLPADPVWVFPRSGEKYHTENCTYVKASVHQAVLTSSLRSRYASCSACHSQTCENGSVVYCFDGEDTAFHRGSCRTIQRQTTVIDRTEAMQKGYTPCSKCGGGSSGGS